MKFKNIAIKILIGALNLFAKSIINQLPSEWSKKVATLSVSRLKLFGEALTDANPNDKEQIEVITRETLLSPEFQDLETTLTQDLADKITNKAFANLLIGTDKLRLQFFGVLGDGNTDNSAQINELFNGYVKTEEFDSLAIEMATLLADKYAKNELVKQFLIDAITELVNSDDNQPV